MSRALVVVRSHGSAGDAARHALFVLCGVCLAACSQSPECADAAQQLLVGGTAVADAGGVLLRAVPEGAQVVVCTGIQLSADSYLTAGHCAEYAPGSKTHPSLDLALAPGLVAGFRASLPVYLGDLPEHARILAYATEPGAKLPIQVGRVVEGNVLLNASSGDAYLSAEVQGDGPSACEGDSGSGLFLDSDRGPLLLGVLSSSAAAPGSLCTPTSGQQYWVRLSAARDWLEQQLGPCEPGLSNAGSYCVFPERASESACPRTAAGE